MTNEEALALIAEQKTIIEAAKVRIRAIENTFILDNCEFQVGERVIVNANRKPWIGQITAIKVDISKSNVWWRYSGVQILKSGELSENVREFWQGVTKL